MTEKWRDIKGYEGLYQVSNLGRVKSLERETKHHYKLGGSHTISEKCIKLFKNRYGYLKCYLYKEGKRKEFKVHRLVAEAFIPNPNSLPQINHKNEIKDCNVVNINDLYGKTTNLEWCTNKYNAEYSKNKPVIQYDLNFKKIREWGSQLKASKETQINNRHISSCCNGKRKTAGGYIWRFKESEEIICLINQ